MKNLRFKYCSLLLSYPDENLFEELELLEKNLLHSLPEAFSYYLRKIPLEKLKEEYTYLFISSFPKIPCPPYESYYREGLLFGKTTQEVKDYYESQGFQFSKEGEAPDHIAVELEFLALTEDLNFLNIIFQWIEDFKKCVEKASSIYTPIVNFIYEELKRWKDGERK